MTKPRFLPLYVKNKVRYSLTYVFLFLAIITIVVAVYRGGVHIAALEPNQITIQELPSALTLSLMRMIISYLASLVFGFGLGLIAARTLWGERVVIPLLDILQSVPIVGFFPAAITFFISISSGHRIGVEMAAIFLIFTSQAWNLAFAVYESIKSIPEDKVDAILSYGVSGSERFWKLYAPACVPRLVYNSILSWSNGWFFLVACEIIAVGPARYDLPGIGSFLARAAEQDQIYLIMWGLVALTLLILLLDFLLWRPASVWALKFKQDTSTGTDEEVEFESLPQSVLAKITDWFPFILVPARKMMRALIYPFYWSLKEVLLPIFWDLPYAILRAFIFRFKHQSFFKLFARKLDTLAKIFYWALGIGGSLVMVFILVKWLLPPWPDIVRKEIISEIPSAILVSTGRLILALFLSLLWILPLVLFTWNRPRIRQTLSTVAQIGASLPAIALFPLFIVMAVKHVGGGMEAASILLLLTGMQWYLLFNCLGGTASIPAELAESTKSLGIKGFLSWKTLVIPAIRPALVTGAITAWGGGWNALVVAEYVNYKDEVLKVKGIGALLNYSVYELGDGKAITLCVAAMVGWILLLNIVFWRPLYQNTIDKFKFEG